MRCQDVERLSSQYIDDELDPVRVEELRGHLRKCVACRRSVSDLAAIVDAAAQLPAPEPPASIWTAIERQLARPIPAPSLLQRTAMKMSGFMAAVMRARVAPMAGVALAAVAGVWMMRTDAPPVQLDDTGSPRVSGHRYVALDDISDRAQAADATILGQWAHRLRVTDQRYVETIRELRELVAEERGDWPDQLGLAFDERLHRFEAAAARHRAALAQADAHDVAARDELYDVYRAEISFLQRAALDGPPELPTESEIQP